MWSGWRSRRNFFLHPNNTPAKIEDWISNQERRVGAFGCEDVGYTKSVRDNKFTTTTAARLCVWDLQGAQSSANRQKRQRQINECVFLPLLFHLIPPRPPIFLPSLIIVIIIPLTRFVWLYQTTWGAEKTHGSREPSTSRPIIHTAYGIRYTDCQRRALPPLGQQVCPLNRWRRRGSGLNPETKAATARLKHRARLPETEPLPPGDPRKAQGPPSRLPAPTQREPKAWGGQGRH